MNKYSNLGQYGYVSSIILWDFEYFRLFWEEEQGDCTERPSLDTQLQP